MSKDRRTFVRWRALAPLGVFLVLVVVLWLLFADRIARRSLEEIGTQILGAQVDIDWLRLRERASTVEMGGLAIANPFDLDRNLLDVGHLTVDLDPGALLEKKVVVRRLVLADLAVGQVRDEPAKAVEGGAAGRMAQAFDEVRARLAQPTFGIALADSIREVVLQPEDLASVQAAGRLRASADSLRLATVDRLAGLDPSSLVTESEEVARRVAEASPAQLGVTGMQQLVTDARGVIARLEEAEARLDSARAALAGGVDEVTRGVQRVEEARREDLQRVSAMVGLPALDAPSIGGALFGDVSLSYVERAWHWIDLARRYMPPGLLPRSRPGGARLRAPGTDVLFPKEGAYPSFHLVEGTLAQDTAGAGSGVVHRLALADLTSAPALVGRPARIDYHLSQEGRDRVSVGLALDHTAARPVDSVSARVSALVLPPVELPGTGLTLAPGPGTAGLTAVLDGDRFEATWAFRTDDVSWQTGAASGSDLTALLQRAVRGMTRLEVSASLGGTLQGLDRFRVSSNLDQALANALQAAAGEAVAEARARAQAEVDRLSRQVVDSALSQAGRVTAQATSGVTAWEEELAAARAELERQLRAKTGGVRLF